MTMLERKDMVLLAENRLKEFIAHPPAEVLEYAVRMTSGTTGTPIVTVFASSSTALKPLEHSTNILATIGSLSTRLGIVVLTRRLKHPAHVLVLSNADIVPASSALLDQFAPDCVSGSPTFAARAGEIMGDNTAGGVALVSVRGEYLSAVLADTLAARYPHARIETTYIANETGAIATAACRPSPLTYYHPLPSVHIDILDPDESGAGEVLVTKNEGDFIFERYHIGDIGRIHTERCACGKEILELWGRKGGDYIKCAGAVVRREELDRVAALLARFFDDYHAEVSELSEGGSLKGKIVLRVYSGGGPGTPALAQEIARNVSKELFLTPTQTLENLVDKGAFMPLEVVFVAAPFPKKNKEVKLSKVI